MAAKSAAVAVKYDRRVKRLMQTVQDLEKKAKREAKKFHKEKIELELALLAAKNANTQLDVRARKAEEAETAAREALAKVEKEKSDLEVEMASQMERLRKSRAEEVKRERLRVQREEGLKFKERLDQFRQYLADQERIEGAFLEANQLEGSLGVLDEVEEKFGFKVPEDYVAELEKRQEEKGAWVKSQSVLKVTDLNLDMPDIPEEPLNVSLARDSPSVRAPAGVEQYGSNDGLALLRVEDPAS